MSRPIVRNLVLPAVAAGSVSFLAAVGIASAMGAPTLTPAPAPGPTAVVTTTQPAERLAPRCFETSTAGAEDCAWVPVVQCLSDEDGDDAVPDGYDGCYWDATTQGDHAGASYVYWRLNRG